MTVLTVVCGLTTGCGDGRPTRVPVSGQVLIDGQPLRSGAVRFVPTMSRPATGQIGTDGRFTLMTFEPRDGCVLGTHKVAIFAIERLGSTAIRYNAPKKYLNPETSGLTSTINGPTDDVTIQLTWDGGKPFTEKSEE